MTPGAVAAFFVLFVGSTIVASVLACYSPPASNAGLGDAASVLTFITVTAVAIERVIEVMWTMLGQKQGFGGWWPLKEVIARAQTIEKDTNALLKGPFDSVKAALEQAKGFSGTTGDKLVKIEEQLEELESSHTAFSERLTAAKQLAPGSARVALAAGVANDATRLLTNATAVAKGFSKIAIAQVAQANNAISIATGIVASFDDNPARRIASIVLGTSAGMIVSAFVGLNMFAAILGASGLLAGTTGILATGLLIGLGSNPTHEVIKALQNHKKSRQPGTATLVAEPVTDEGSVRAVMPDRQPRVGHDAVREFALLGRSTDEGVVIFRPGAPAAKWQSRVVTLRSTD